MDAIWSITGYYIAHRYFIVHTTEYLWKSKVTVKQNLTKRKLLFIFFPLTLAHLFKLLPFHLVEIFGKWNRKYIKIMDF